MQQMSVPGPFSRNASTADACNCRTEPLGMFSFPVCPAVVHHCICSTRVCEFGYARKCQVRCVSTAGADCAVCTVISAAMQSSDQPATRSFVANLRTYMAALIGLSGDTIPTRPVAGCGFSHPQVDKFANIRQL
jgi:hypothetical protein